MIWTIDTQTTRIYLTSKNNLIKKLELENIIESRTKGAILRSKTKWYNKGEKNTKYFLNLEKRHFKQGTISQVKINDNEFVTSDEKILSECELFYKNLYTSKHKASNDHDTTLSFEHGTTMSFMTTNRRHVKGR